MVRPALASAQAHGEHVLRSSRGNLSSTGCPARGNPATLFLVETVIVETVMRVQVGELRLAWALLAVLAWLAFPDSPPAGRLTLIVAFLCFAPGALMLISSRASARIASELETLLASSLGRASVVAALAVAALLGIIFPRFVGPFVIGAASEVIWLVLLLWPGASLVRFFPSLSAAAAVTLGTLVATDAILNWRPFARDIGAPTELAMWNGRYDDVKANNFFRFRSRYEDTRRRPGVRRIVTLGDSFTEGHGIWSSDSTWPAQLERELNSGPDAVPTEVINMGHGGFTTANEAELLRRIGWQFDPDLVIVQWLDNDAYPSYPNLRWKQPEPRAIIPERLRDGLIRKSAIVSVLERMTEEALPPTRSYYGPNQVGWVQLQAALKEMADSASRRCVPIMLAAYPYLFPGHWTSETYPERDLTQMVTALAEKDGYAVLDLTDVFAPVNRRQEDWWVTPYDTHPNALAQHHAVLAMSRFIRERHLLPQTPGAAPRCR